MNYKELGLKIGIEIHQRLNTKKLFCDCTSKQQDNENNEITRKLRPVAGELGGIDPAAMHEHLRDKTFVYKAFPNESCLVETDSEPPHDVNPDALKTVLKICKLFDATIVDEVHVMRKTVIDGSNTGGFQRTMVVGLNGAIETSFGKIKIDGIALEEEAARIEDQTPNKSIYKLQGLAIPLVEIGTEPKAKTPDEALELAFKLGSALRALNIQRGIGSIRQDVNVSIRAGERVEIKGFQEVKKIPELIDNEINRQLALLLIKQELETRKFNPENIPAPKDVTDAFSQTSCNFIKRIVKDQGFVYAIHLPKFRGLLKENCGGHTFGKELSYYAQPLQGMIHTDEKLETYEIVNEIEEAKGKFNFSDKKDLIAIVAGKNKGDVIKAAKSVINRAKKCLEGVPKETRVALPDATSKFTRPLPGSDRMYPETDLPPIVMDLDYVKKIKKPETLEERKMFLDKVLPEELANQILTSEHYDTFKSMTGQDPVLIATTFLSTMKNLQRKGVDPKRLTKQQLQKVFDLVERNKLPKDSVPKVVEEVARGRKLEEAIEKFGRMTDDQIDKLVDKIVDSSPVKKISVLMGNFMKEAEGRVSGEDAAKAIEKKLGKKDKKKSDKEPNENKRE